MAANPIEYSWKILSLSQDGKLFEVEYKATQHPELSVEKIFLPMPLTQAEVESSIQVHAGAIVARWQQQLAGAALDTAQLIGLSGTTVSAGLGVQNANSVLPATVGIDMTVTP